MGKKKIYKKNEELYFNLSLIFLLMSLGLLIISVYGVTTQFIILFEAVYVSWAIMAAVIFWRLFNHKK